MTDPMTPAPTGDGKAAGLRARDAAASGATDSRWIELITPGRFAGHTVVVSGAAAGIGRATATRVAREGGRVVAVDISGAGLADLAEELSDVELITVTADITSTADVAAVVAAADGRVDGLANVVGINDDFSPLHETTDAMWDRVLAVNLTGAFKLTRALLPIMLDAGYGSVVNVASGAGLKGSGSGNAYTTSKHAMIGLTRSAAFMYARSGIRVNAVAPGGVATDMPFPEDLSEFGRSQLAPFHALVPSMASAAQIAASITFLLSADAVNINGAVLSSDGGYCAQ